MGVFTGQLTASPGRVWSLRRVLSCRRRLEDTVEHLPPTWCSPLVHLIQHHLPSLSLGSERDVVRLGRA